MSNKMVTWLVIGEREWKSRGPKQSINRIRVRITEWLANDTIFFKRERKWNINITSKGPMELIPWKPICRILAFLEVNYLIKNTVKKRTEKSHNLKTPGILSPTLPYATSNKTL